MNVLSEVEVARLLTAYAELEDETDVEQAPWWRLARQIVQVALGTALRRGQLLALRWQDVELLEGRLSVRQGFVRNEFTSPKSRSSWRTIELGGPTLRQAAANLLSVVMEVLNDRFRLQERVARNGQRAAPVHQHAGR